MLEKWSRTLFLALSLVITVVIVIVALSKPIAWWSFALFGPFMVLGLYGIVQRKHTLLRNFPLLGHFRFLLESIRPEIRQYFVEGDEEESPFSREKRSVVYQRAKGTLDTLPFGTRRNVYQIGYEWINHSLSPTEMNPDLARVSLGEQSCT
ncbi:MAG TPA: FMN-binding glutamate synthase family protein, partial [Geoalkalibacter subterraneus]|nr:FMN-binding glutamate synthase family protein [Geoalkalibacter subterraneus]